MDEKDKNSEQPVVTEQAPVERISDADMLALERANTKRQLALKDAKTATLEAEYAELNYKNLVMQLFLKHGLSQEDAIQPDGTLVRRSQDKKEE